MKELITALTNARAEFKAVVKNKTNPHFKNSYADLDAILEAITPALCKHELLVSQVVEGDRLLTRVFHSSGNYLESSYPLPYVADPQRMGASLTYARRYSLSAILSVASEDDDNGNSAATPPSRTSVAALNLITDAQRKRLFAIAKTKEVPNDSLKTLVESHGFESSHDITREAYDKIVRDLEAM